MESGELPSNDEELISLYNNFVDNNNKLNNEHLNNIYKSHNNNDNNKEFFKILLQFISTPSSALSTSNNDMKLDFIFAIFNSFIENNWTNKECFSEILFNLSINQNNADDSDRLLSVLNYSKLFNDNENSIEFFNVLFSFIQSDNRIDNINNGIELLGSIISLSISFGFSNILNLTSEWLFKFSRIQIPAIIKETYGLNNNNNNNNNSNNNNNGDEINTFGISFKLLKYILNDHLISNESSNNFEMLPIYSKDFTCICLTIILSYYLNPFNRDQVIKKGLEELEYCEFIIPKLTSLLSNYWLVSNNSGNEINIDSILFKSPIKELSASTNSTSPFTSNTILKELITVCIFSTYPTTLPSDSSSDSNNANKKEEILENIELIKPYLQKISSIILEKLSIKQDGLFNGIGSSNNEIQIQKKKFIKSELTIDYFNNIIAELNNNNSNNNQTSVNLLYSIIVVLSSSFENDKEYSNALLELLPKLNIKSKYSINK